MGHSAERGSFVGVTAYLLLAFGIAWAFWLTLLPASAPGHLAAFEIAALPGAFAPALATFIVRRWITCEGFADAGLKLNLKQWRLYLFAWFLPYGVVAFIVASAYLIGLGLPDFSPAVAHIPAQIPRAVAPFVAPVMLALTALIATPVLFGEEFGWRGYLQLRLFQSRPTLAAIATGIVWGLWHLPVILRGYELPGNRTLATAMFCISTVLISIIFGWLREKSGSVWVTSLAHSATNAIGGSLTVLWYPGPERAVFVSYAGLLAWIPLGLVCLWIIAKRMHGEPEDMASKSSLALPKSA